MSKTPRYAKRSQAQQKLAAVRPRNSMGRFEKGNTPTLKPNGSTPYDNMFIGIPNPLHKIYRNPDEAVQQDPENATRMLADLQIVSSLQERQLACAELPWSIIPENTADPEQNEACAEITKIIGDIPDFTDYVRNLLQAVWFGRSANINEYDWDYTKGYRRLIVRDWQPVHGDTLLFGDNGTVGYRVGVGAAIRTPIISLEGRGELLSSDDREAWTIHQYQRTAGEFRLPWGAGSIFGVGLRSKVYYSWYLKQELKAYIHQAAERFGCGWLIGWYDMHNPASQNAMRESMMAQQGNHIQMYPRSAGEESAEGIDMLESSGQSWSDMLSMIDHYDNQIRLAICGQTLTANAESTGLGSSVAEAHQSTFAKLIRYDALCLQESLTKDLVSVLQKYNGFVGYKCKFHFAIDEPFVKDMIESAQILQQMGADIDLDVLIEKAGLSKSNH